MAKHILIFIVIEMWYVTTDDVMSQCESSYRIPYWTTGTGVPLMCPTNHCPLLELPNSICMRGQLPLPLATSGLLLDTIQAAQYGNFEETTQLGRSCT